MAGATLHHDVHHPSQPCALVSCQPQDATTPRHTSQHAQAQLHNYQLTTSSLVGGLSTGMNIECTYYINLESRPDRRHDMETMLGKHEVNAFRFEAITPDNPMVQPYMEKAQRLKPNEAACALSHFEVWKLIAKCGRGTAACVLEDDVRFMTTWREQVTSAMSKLPEDWDLLLLDCYYLAEEWDFSGVKRWVPGVFQEVEVRPAVACSFADAYILTQEAAEWCLSQVEECPWRNAEAILISLQDRNKSFTTMPKIVLQRWENSNIQGSGFVGAMQKFYKDTYFKYYPEALYEP